MTEQNYYRRLQHVWRSVNSAFVEALRREYRYMVWHVACLNVMLVAAAFAVNYHTLTKLLMVLMPLLSYLHLWALRNRINDLSMATPEIGEA